MDGTELKLTLEECQGLFTLMVDVKTFAALLPDKLGSTALPVEDRAIAADEVRALYQDFRARSPFWSRPVDKVGLFGPSEEYEQNKIEGGMSYKAKDPKKEFKVKLPESAISGVLWLLFAGLCPGGPVCQTIPVQEDILWPIAAKLGRTKQLREMIGYGKGTHRRWLTDEEIDKEKKTEKPEEKKP